MNKNSAATLKLLQPHSFGCPLSTGTLFVIDIQKPSEVPVSTMRYWLGGNYTAWSGSANPLTFGLTLSAVQSAAGLSAPTEGWNFVGDESEIAARYDGETDSLISKMVQAKHEIGDAGSDLIDRIGQSISKLRD